MMLWYAFSGRRSVSTDSPSRSIRRLAIVVSNRCLFGLAFETKQVRTSKFQPRWKELGPENAGALGLQSFWQERSLGFTV